jgi:manganese/zinc/iron transport system permease protein
MMFIVWYVLLVPVCGVAIIGALSGLIGTFAFLKQQTMLGDTISHAALPGIICMFLLTHSSNPIVLVTGGLITGLFAVLLLSFLAWSTSLASDALLGIVLSVFFGIGLVLLTYVQKIALSEQSVLNKFLFGSAATLLYNDVHMLCCIAVLISMVLLMLWKEFVLIVFDPVYARSCGYSVILIQSLLYFMMVITIVSGLYAVGVVLMSSLLVAPAVTARYMTKSVHGMAIIAAACGAFACVSGVLMSAVIPHMPTGPVIVMISTVGALIALLMRNIQGAIL